MNPTGLQITEFSGSDVKCAPIAMEYTTGFARDAMLIQIVNQIFRELPQNRLWNKAVTRSLLKECLYLLEVQILFGTS
jgi:hypothetical protein